MRNVMELFEAGGLWKGQIVIFNEVENVEVFNDIKHFLATGTHRPAPTVQDRVDACRKHLDFSLRWKGERTGIVEMRRHYANYFKGLPDFKPFRMRLVLTYSLDELASILDEVSEAYETVLM